MDFDASIPIYAHDANGNLTDDGVFQYQYDSANQLTNVVRTADGARVLSARYDALGRRVEATRADGSVERYVYFPGSFLVLAVLDGTNAVKEIYTRGPDLSGSPDGAGGIGGLLAVTDSSSVVRYYHADIMGNVIALTDASGSVVATFRYTPFGQFSARTGSVLPRYLFSSKEFDRTANLYYYGYRYYAPRLGRWMTRDPLGENAGMNLYAFLKNFSQNGIDPKGTDIYLTTGNKSAAWWEFLNHYLHQEICVDTWRKDKLNPCCLKRGPRQCYSYAFEKISWVSPQLTWLGHSNLQLGSLLQGSVYFPLTPQGMRDTKTLKTSCWQDREFIEKLTQLLNHSGSYDPWHSCRTFSQMMFEAAVKAYGNAPSAETSAINDGGCECPEKSGDEETLSKK